MARRTEAYVDTSALIAFVDRSDTHHPLFRRIFADPPKLVTTPLVIAEGHGWFLRRYDRERARAFMSLIEDLRPLQTLRIGSRELREATELLRRFSDQDLTIADAAGLAVMAERAIDTCWSTDFHLGLTGVRLVIHEH